MNESQFRKTEGRCPVVQKLSHISLYILILLAFFTLSPLKTLAADAGTESVGASAGWVKDNNGYRYRLTNNTYVKDKFYKIGKYTYYFNSKGYRLTGWQKINKKIYSFTGTGKMRTGWSKIKEKIFCFTSNGALRTGWYKPDGGKKFYLSKSGGMGKKGQLVTGWEIISDNMYYFQPKGELGQIGAAVCGGWVKIDGEEYYFSADGINTTKRMTNQEFIEMVGELAVYDMRQNHILASVTIAQAILESGYGQSELALEGNNLFGMRASLSDDNWGSKWKGRVVYRTKNGVREPFRAYDSILESIEDHSNYLLHATTNGTKLRYEGIEKATTVRKAGKILVDGGYTSGYSYVDTLVSLANTYKLTSYDKRGREPLAG